MVNFIKRLFGKKASSEQTFTDEEYENYQEAKQLALEDILGKMHDLVGHAIIPFQIGGAVDMYYFLNHIPGSGFATMELLEPNGKGPKANKLGTYELVAFTKHPYSEDKNQQVPFNHIERRICGIFTAIGFYSKDAKLNPGETCEVPNEGESNICLLFDKYPQNKDLIIAGSKHHLLLCIEIFPSEMHFARVNGSQELLVKLKEAGFYPYSDLDRTPVV